MREHYLFTVLALLVLSGCQEPSAGMRDRGPTASALSPEEPTHPYSAVPNTGVLRATENREHPGLVVLLPKLPEEQDLKEFTGTKSTRSAAMIDLSEGMETEGMDTKFEIKDICGRPDWRTVDPRTVPGRFVVSLRIHVAGSSAVYSGTGALIGPRCILTAGHNLHSVKLPQKSWVSSVEVYAGRIGEWCAVKSTSSTFRSIEGWVNGDQNTNDFDIGAIILPDDRIYRWAQGHFGVDPGGAMNDVILLGYPWAEGVSELKGKQYTSRGAAVGTERTLQYMLDTYAGHSGSPVFPAANISLIGVHAGGGCPNKSIRINRDLLERIAEWTEL